MAKQHKLKANAKSSDLINQLVAIHAGEQTLQDENSDLSNSVTQRSSPLLQHRRKKEQRRKTISRITLRGSPNGLNSSFENLSIDTLSPLRHEFRPRRQEKSVAQLCQYSVNAIKALNCKNGARFDQIFNFLRQNVAEDLTIERMKQVLVFANEQNRIVAVQDSKTSDVRFLIPSQGKQTKAAPPRSSHRKAFPGSKAFMRSALHNAMVSERRRRIKSRLAYVNTWGQQAKALDKKIHSQCTCRLCGCAGPAAPAKAQPKEVVDVVKPLNPQLKALASNNSKKKSRRFSLQALYRSSSKGSAEKAEKANRTATEIVTVPAGWELMESRTKPGKFYYYNPITNERMWKEPGH